MRTSEDITHDAPTSRGERRRLARSPRHPRHPRSVGVPPHVGPICAPSRRRRVSHSLSRLFKGRALMALSIILVVGALMAVVVGQAMLANGQVRMATIEHELTLEQSVHRQIELTDSALETPARIVAAATGGLHMVHSPVIELPYVSLTTPLPAPTVTPPPAATPRPLPAPRHRPGQPRHRPGQPRHRPGQLRHRPGQLRHRPGQPRHRPPLRVLPPRRRRHERHHPTCRSARALSHLEPRLGTASRAVVACGADRPPGPARSPTGLGTSEPAHPGRAGSPPPQQQRPSEGPASPDQIPGPGAVPGPPRCLGLGHLRPTGPPDPIAAGGRPPLAGGSPGRCPGAALEPVHRSGPRRGVHLGAPALLARRPLRPQRLPAGPLGRHRRRGGRRLPGDAPASLPRRP